MDPSNNDEWQRTKEVFEGALALQGDDRAAFLERACRGNVSLRAEIDSLLESYGEASDFMEAPAVAFAAKSIVGEHKRLRIGQLVKHYEILKLIGEGGMGEVYLARDTALGRRLALKVLPEYIGQDPDRLKRFKQEARTASTLNHPGVCVIYEIAETDDGRPFIAMEYIEGVTLRQRLIDRPLKLGDVLEIAIQVANALTAAHEHGIVHRDIKPENIMIRRDGIVKVFDFGLAKLTERSPSLSTQTLSTLLVNSSPGTVMGTTAYMSPEQARGLAVDPRTDIWSFGVVLYEMISRRPPFVGETPTDVVVAIVEKEPPALSDLLSDISAELERIVRKALRKDANERYQIAKEMATDLRVLQKDLESKAQLDRSIAPATAAGTRGATTGEDKALRTDQLSTTQPTTFGIAQPKRKWWPLAAAAVLVVGVVAAVALYKFLGRSAAPPARFQRTSVIKLTTNGNALFASISPDGKYVAYVKSENGKESLWVRQVAGAGSLEVVPPREGGHYLGLAFAPDGESIYYGYATAGTTDNAEVFRLPVLGTGAPPTKVNPDIGPSNLSHDGKRIAFLRYSRANQTDSMVIANADGSNEQALVTRKWPDRLSWDWASAPAWTNDDQNLVLPLVNSDTTGFYVTILEVNLSDRSEKTIPLSPQHFEQPNHVSMVSDASAVILSARAAGASFEQVWYFGRDGSVRPLTNDLSDYRAVTLTADSRSFVTTQTQTLTNIWVAPKGDLARSGQITTGFGRYFDLSCAPDGKIVYASDASGSADIYEISADGRNVRQLTSNIKRNYAPAVSPDNRFIAFHSNRNGVFQIWRMDRDGSNPVQLTFGTSESHWPQFSVDGKWIIYEHSEPDANGTLWRVPVEGGTPQNIATGFASRPTVSPDGKWLGYWYNDGKPGTPWRLALFSLETATQVKTFPVAPTVIVGWDTLLRWDADSTALAFVDAHDGFENIWIQPIDGSPAKQLTDFKDRKIFSFDWARTGDLAVSKGVTTSDVVLMSDASDQ